EVYAASVQMIADRLDGENDDCPECKGNQRHDSELAPATRVERFFRQARRDKAGDVNLLPVGIGARLIEPVQRMLVRGLRKAPLTLQLLVRAELARQRIVAVWIAVRQVARNDARLPVARTDAPCGPLHRWVI